MKKNNCPECGRLKDSRYKRCGHCAVWNLSEETRQKMSAAKKGRKLSEEHRRRISEGHRGIKNNNYGKHHSQETKRKQSEAHSGERHYNYGKHLSEKTRRNISESLKGDRNPQYGKPFYRGEKNHQWRGGLSSEPYSVDWTLTLRKSIRERDHYICRVCNNENAMDVHHIDYIKMHNDPGNLITLCRGCHVKTNHNREAWTLFFGDLIQTAPAL